MLELNDLHCLKQSLPHNERKRPLSELALMDHIHGELILRPDGEHAIHNFGYWGTSDACIGQWLTVFQRMIKMIDVGGEFTYQFPFPDQGDPLLEFVFSSESVTVRTIYYTDDSWSEVEEQSEISVDRVGFENAICKAPCLIADTILSESPNVGAAWLERQKE